VPIGTWVTSPTTSCGTFTYTIASYPTPPVGSTPISVLNNAHIKVQSSSALDDASYSVTLTGQNTLYSHLTASVSFNVIIFDPSVSYISTVPVAPITYFIGDPMLTTTFHPFTSSRTYLPPLYTVVKSDWSAITSPLMAFSNLAFDLSSTSSADAGTYSLLLASYFSTSTPYKVSSAFTVTILDACMRNVITAPTIPD